MTTMDKIARRKLSLLDLASELSNVSRACKITGYSRQQFYEIRRNFQTYGAEGLLDRMPGAKVIPPILEGVWGRTHAAICVCILRFSFWAGVMPPRPMLGRSLL